MNHYKFMGLSLAAMVTLAGCTDPSNMTEAEREVLRGNNNLADNFGGGSTFGSWRRSNDAAQIVDPAPAYAQDSPTFDGQVMIGAFGRYRTDKVKQPEEIGTDF